MAERATRSAMRKRATQTGKRVTQTDDLEYGHVYAIVTVNPSLNALLDGHLFQLSHGHNLPLRWSQFLYFNKLNEDFKKEKDGVILHVKGGVTRLSYLQDLTDQNSSIESVSTENDHLGRRIVFIDVTPQKILDDIHPDYSKYDLSEYKVSLRPGSRTWQFES